jgi:hypothetical protein
VYERQARTTGASIRYRIVGDRSADMPDSLQPASVALQSEVSVGPTPHIALRVTRPVPGADMIAEQKGNSTNGRLADHAASPMLGLLRSKRYRSRILSPENWASIGAAASSAAASS